MRNRPEIGRIVATNLENTKDVPNLKLKKTRQRSFIHSKTELEHLLD